MAEACRAAAVVACQGEEACQEETCQASFVDTLEAVHHTALVAKVWAVQSQEAAASQVGSSHTFVEGTAGVGTGRPAAAG